jgi:hypothetical protein
LANIKPYCISSLLTTNGIIEVEIVKKTFRVILDFEKPVIDLQKKIVEMEEYARETGINLTDDIKRLQKKAESLRQEIYSKLTPWQRVQLARHLDRPYTLDYIKRITNDFIELHGDRYFADDPAMITGLAKIDDYRVVLIGQQKGRDVKENLYRNFGMSNPEDSRSLPSLTRPGLIPESGRKNAARQKQLHGIFWKCPGCLFRLLLWLSAKERPEERWASEWEMSF